MSFLQLIVVKIPKKLKKSTPIPAVCLLVKGSLVAQANKNNLWILIIERILSFLNLDYKIFWVTKASDFKKIIECH